MLHRKAQGGTTSTESTIHYNELPKKPEFDYTSTSLKQTISPLETTSSSLSPQQEGQIQIQFIKVTHKVRNAIIGLGILICIGLFIYILYEINNLSGGKGGPGSKGEDGSIGLNGTIGLDGQSAGAIYPFQPNGSCIGIIVSSPVNKTSFVNTTEITCPSSGKPGDVGPIGPGISFTVINSSCINVYNASNGASFPLCANKGDQGSRGYGVSYTFINSSCINLFNESNGASIVICAPSGVKGDTGYGISFAVINNTCINVFNGSNSASFVWCSSPGNKGDTGFGISFAVINASCVNIFNGSNGASFVWCAQVGQKGDTGYGVSFTVINASCINVNNGSNGASFTWCAQVGQKGDTGSGISFSVINSTCINVLNQSNAASFVWCSQIGATGPGISFSVINNTCINVLNGSNGASFVWCSQVGNTGAAGYSISFNYYNSTCITVVNGSNGASTILCINSIAPSAAYQVYVDQQPSGTNGGSSVANTWTTRVLNTALSGNLDGITTSLSSNQVTIQPGNYVLRASAPAFESASHMIRIYCVTDSAVLVYGSTEYSYTTVSPQTRSFAEALISITSAKTYRIEHNVQQSQASNGFGATAGFTATNTYAIFEILQSSGSQGIQGIQGATGPGISYSVINSTCINIVNGSNSASFVMCGQAGTGGGTYSQTLVQTISVGKTDNSWSNSSTASYVHLSPFSLRFLTTATSPYGWLQYQLSSYSAGTYLVQFECMCGALDKGQFILQEVTNNVNITLVIDTYDSTAGTNGVTAATGGDYVCRFTSNSFSHIGGNIILKWWVVSTSGTGYNVVLNGQVNLIQIFAGITPNSIGFLNLNDVSPQSYSGKSGQFVQVNSAASGLTFVSTGVQVYAKYGANGNTGSGGCTGTTWTNFTYTTAVSGNLDGISTSISTYLVTLQPGVYRIDARNSFYTPNRIQIRLLSSIGTFYGDSVYALNSDTTTATAMVTAYVSLTSATGFTLQYYVATAQAGTRCLGFDSNSGAGDYWNPMVIQKIG